MPLDLIGTRQQLLEQNAGSAARMGESARIAQSDACAHVFRPLTPDEAPTVPSTAPPILPCHIEGELPTGLVLWHGALHDDALPSLGLQVEAAPAQ